MVLNHFIKWRNARGYPNKVRDKVKYAHYFCYHLALHWTLLTSNILFLNVGGYMCDDFINIS